MAKKVVKVVKLQLPAAKATPAPPVGPTLGQAGINMMQFLKEFNERTAQQAGLIIPVEISVYQDRSLTFILKTPPAAVLLKKAANIETASGEPNKKKAGRVSRAQVREIAEMKMPDLNAASVEAAMRMVEGTARSMGIDDNCSRATMPPNARESPSAAIWRQRFTNTSVRSFHGMSSCLIICTAAPHMRDRRQEIRRGGYNAQARKKL